MTRGAVSSTCHYLLLQLFFNIVLLNGDLTISLKSFVELVSDVPFHAVFCTNITDAADMGPEGWNSVFQNQVGAKELKDEVTLRT